MPTSTDTGGPDHLEAHRHGNELENRIRSPIKNLQVSRPGGNPLNPIRVFQQNRPTYSVEKLVSEAHTILKTNKKLAENPQ